MLAATAFVSILCAGPMDVGAIDAAIARLRSASDEQRSAAARELGAQGRDARPAVPALVDCLTDRDDRLRYDATWALAQIGGVESAHLPALLDLLDDPSPPTRAQALRVLTETGAGASSGATRVASLLEDPSHDVRREAARALCRMGRPGLDQVLSVWTADDSPGQASMAAHIENAGAPLVAELRTALADATPETRPAIIDVLGTIGGNAVAAVPELCDLLTSASDGPTRIRAARALGSIDAGRSRSYEALVHALGDDDTDVRIEAARAIARLTDENWAAGPLLAEIVGDQNALFELRRQAALSLHSLDDDDPTPREVLLGIAGNRKEREETRRSAAFALAETGVTEDQLKIVGPILLDAVTDRDPMVRKETLNASAILRWTFEGRIEVAARKALKDSNVEVRATAAHAMSRLAWYEVTTANDLEKLLRNKHALVRSAAASAIGNMGRYGAPAVAGLAKRLGDDDRDVALAAIGSLARIGDDAGAALKPLLKVDPRPDDEAFTVARLNALVAISPQDKAVRRELDSAMLDDRLGVRLAALAGLRVAGGIEPAAEDVVLRDAMSDADKAVRVSAVERAAELESISQPLVESLVLALTDRDYLVREWAAHALGRREEPSPMIVGALIARLDDPHEDVRFFTVEAIRVLHPESDAALEGVKRALTDTSERVRSEACTAFASFGERAIDLIDTLAAIAKTDPSPKVRNERRASARATRRRGRRLTGSAGAPPLAGYARLGGWRPLLTKGDPPMRETLLLVAALLASPAHVDASVPGDADTSRRLKAFRADLDYLYEEIEEPASLRQIFKVKGIDWKKLRRATDKRFKTLATAAGRRSRSDELADQVAFYDVLRFLIGGLRDSHAYVEVDDAIRDAWQAGQPPRFDAGMELLPGAHGVVIVSNTFAARGANSPPLRSGCPTRADHPRVDRRSPCPPTTSKRQPRRSSRKRGGSPLWRARTSKP